ncbi:MAG TPA: MYXO-CTERM sorting domain-containing protein [Polyangia bacterium]|jgi:MYXO-CTERM domain-containing protein
MARFSSVLVAGVVGSIAAFGGAPRALAEDLPLARQILEQGLPGITPDGSEVALRVSHQRAGGFTGGRSAGEDVQFVRKDTPGDLIRYTRTGSQHPDWRDLQPKLKARGFRPLALHQPAGDSVFGFAPRTSPDAGRAERILNAGVKPAGTFEAGGLQFQVSLREGAGGDGLTGTDDLAFAVREGGRQVATGTVALSRMLAVHVTGVAVVPGAAKLVYVRLNQRTGPRSATVMDAASVNDEVWLRIPLAAAPAGAPGGAAASAPAAAPASAPAAASAPAPRAGTPAATTPPAPAQPVAPPAPAPAKGGCGCRAATAAPSAGPALLLLALALAGHRRRR